jgi:hypothetical protein
MCAHELRSVRVKKGEDVMVGYGLISLRDVIGVTLGDAFRLRAWVVEPLLDLSQGELRKV